jgi:hypothetical protein
VIFALQIVDQYTNTQYSLHSTERTTLCLCVCVTITYCLSRAVLYPHHPSGRKRRVKSEGEAYYVLRTVRKREVRSAPLPLESRDLSLSERDVGCMLSTYA